MEHQCATVHFTFISGVLPLSRTGMINRAGPEVIVSFCVFSVLLTFRSFVENFVDNLVEVR